jgi:ankyrin repeat protein
MTMTSCLDGRAFLEKKVLPLSSCLPFQLTTMSEQFDLGKACMDGEDSLQTVRISTNPPLTGNTNMILRYLDNLDDAASIINKTDKDKRTPLHWASSMGLIEVVRSLCDKGADTEIRDEGGWTALMIASSAGRALVVEELLYRGADPAAANPRGQTSLHYAASKGHTDVARALLVNGKGGADINVRDKAKQCPM